MRFTHSEEFSFCRAIKAVDSTVDPTTSSNCVSISGASSKFSPQASKTFSAAMPTEDDCSRVDYESPVSTDTVTGYTLDCLRVRTFSVTDS